MSLWTYKPVVKNEVERPPVDCATESTDGGLNVSETLDVSGTLDIAVTESPDDSETEAATLGCLPVGARLIVRCRKDWRDATVVAVTFEAVTLSVISPTGRTYRLRRPPGSAISFDGSIPLLGEGHWRAGLARYDTRW